MGAAQWFQGLLGFEHANAAAEALQAAKKSARGAASVLEHVRQEDCVLVVDVRADMPSSLWEPTVMAFGQLAGWARCGGVTMLYDGDGYEYEVRMAPASTGALDVRPRPSAWLPLANGDQRFERAHKGETRDAEFKVVWFPRDVPGLAVYDWCGMFMDLVPDGDRLYAVSAPDSEDPRPEDLLVEQPDLHCIANLTLVGSTRLFACAHKEVMTKFHVAGQQEIELRDRVVKDALVLDVDVYELFFDAPQIKQPFKPTEQRRMWLERGRGLVAMRERV